MYFTEGRLFEFERMMKENPEYKREPVEAAKDQNDISGMYSGKYDKNEMKDVDRPGGSADDCDRFFNAQNREAR